MEALFIFTLVYLAVKMIRGPSRPPLLPRGLPSRPLIVTYILVAAALGFAVRLVIPVGQSVHNLQLGFFPMYVMLFAADIKAGNEAWPFLGGLTWQSGAYALWEAVAGTFLFIVTFVLFARARGRAGALLAAPATTCGSRRRACPADRRKGT